MNGFKFQFYLCPVVEWFVFLNRKSAEKKKEIDHRRSMP